ncbi:hypothetical protein CANCADRAFT_140646 [Tortispora caseinolytica NRRL Y-17796]|uniref:Isoleucine--tRNA ligase, cytoplasmic n=1 Tax=Tortispora caseinolytica NRRL Y-17796 TaxID=767744 RepID=A0A1E4TCQ3_9ASCO|nr:hypothetical protein CANCADRAFT_140646 [Tortispora caseinolytica NRRL Y-17796]
MDFPKAEEKILEFWNEIDAFQTSLKLSEGNPEFSFYDGPPFATGTPHYGHILASTIKDIVPRYAHMNGHHVTRRFGWDTHGVPVEHEIDKKLGIESKEDVEKMGIAEYNKECRAIVMRYASEWRYTISRVGRWIDFDNDYKTLNDSFMESVWWVFGQIFQKGMVYRSFRVMPYSTGLTTPLSNFEAQQNYKEVLDPAVVISFPLVSDPSTKLLIWTTTPWTLPSNLAIAVNPAFEYIKIHDDATDSNYILLESGLTTLYKNPKKASFQITEKGILGSKLVGEKYTPVFDYFYEKYKDTAFRVIGADYVSSDSGTGLVHQAPAFGEDDFQHCRSSGIFTDDLLPPNPVDDLGCFTADVTDYCGEYVKTADRKIIKDLKARGRLIVDSQIRHSYPFCWRSDTPLIYRAVPAWFIRVPEIVPQILESLNKTRWVPNVIKEGRFANWIANARDWNISRNRYWGNPIPIWVSEDYEEIVCISSVEQLEDLAGLPKGSVTDLHRESIDHITIPSKSGKGVLRRIPEVFDCWFESGSMPYASRHYPFENKDTFQNAFPADFISEGLDQTRGWFYTLCVIGVHLFGEVPFKNCIVSGIVLASDGKKMSKRLKNYPDPLEVINSYGSDALRLYLINSPVLRAETLRFKEEGVKEVVSKVLLPWWNSYKFFEGQELLRQKVTGEGFKYDPSCRSDNVMDKWILAKTQKLIAFIHQEMQEYRLFTVVPQLLGLIDDLTNWYIRFNRRRLKGEAGDDETVYSLNTLFDVLYTLVRAMAPFTPFLSDGIYQKLKPFISESVLNVEDSRSVHFLPYPEAREELYEDNIMRAVERMQSVIELGRVIRDKRTIGLKTPLKELIVLHPDEEYLSDVRSLESYVTEELNVKNIVFTSEEAKYGVKHVCLADWPILGKKLKKDAVRVKKALPDVSSEAAKNYLETGSIVVDGIELVAGDLQVIRTAPVVEDGDFKENAPRMDSNTDRDVLILLDTGVYDELKSDGLAREIINRVQRLRKKAGLQSTDEVRMEYAISGADPINLGSVFVSHEETLTKALRRPLETMSERNDGVIAEEDQEIQDVRFTLRLLQL